MDPRQNINTKPTKYTDKKIAAVPGEHVVTTVITQLVVPKGYEEIIIIDGPNTPTPTGYVKYPDDLNYGAGGAYLYLCTKSSNPGKITDLSLQDTGSIDSPSAPSGYKIVRDQSNREVDLNRGAGGNFIWLSYKSDSSANVITGIGIISSTAAGQNPPEGWVKMGTDLNSGAGGWYIYLIYKK